jgi:hypothetical protein
MKSWLLDLKHQAIIAYDAKDYRKTRFFLSQMLVIAKKIGQKNVIKNYRHNLRKIDEILKSEKMRHA